MAELKRNRDLDFVRGVAILMVIGFHALTVPAKPWLQILEVPLKTLGWSGVDLFFVLSGFLVGGLLMKEYKETGTLNVTRFIIRRGLKIWPAYYFYILFQVAARRHPLGSFLLPNLLHLQNYLPSSLSHTWTLSLEEHFYLLLAFSMGWMARRQWQPRRILGVLISGILLVIVIRCITVFTTTIDVMTLTHTRLDSLLFGVLIATLFHFYPERFAELAARRGLLGGLAASAFLIVILIPQHARAMSLLGFTGIYVGYGALIILIYRHSGIVREWRVYRLVAKIGLYSYGIYLWHLAVRDSSLSLALKMPAAIQWPVLMLLQFSTSILLGIVVTRLIEWPGLRLRERVFRPRREDTPMVAASLQIARHGA